MHGRALRVRAVVAGFLAAALALAPAALAAPSVPRPAHLDPGFGEGGMALVPAALGERREAALTPDGGLVLDSGNSIIRVTGSGQVDTSFGEGGTLTVPAPAGDELQVEGLAVDSGGRLVVAATVTGPYEPFSASGSIGVSNGESPRSVRVMRYLASGAPDPSFGEGGVVESTFGLGSPKDSTGKPLLAKPSATVSGVAIDASDRIVLAGAAADGTRVACYHDADYPILTDAAFIARLTPTGALDLSFGDDGVFGGHGVAENPLRAETAGKPTLGPAGEVLYSNDGGPCPYARSVTGVAKLGPEGKTPSGFGKAGAIEGASGVIAIGPSGEITSLSHLKGRNRDERIGPALLTRFGARGRPDPGFGRGGRRVVVPPGAPGAYLGSAVADPGGGVLIGGELFPRTFRRGKKAETRGPSRPSMVLTGVNAAGKLDREFGSRGFVAARFPGKSVSTVGLFRDGQGRAVLVGTYGSGEGEGWAIARYQLS